MQIDLNELVQILKEQYLDKLPREETTGFMQGVLVGNQEVIDYIENIIGDTNVTNG